VVQEIERYHDRLIFYSLGNFIFDQYFSRATQESMIIKATILSKNNARYELIPINLYQSQPAPMASADTEIFLKNLAQSSAKELREEIIKGVLSAAPVQ